jgi:hypothetical protein
MKSNNICLKKEITQDDTLFFEYIVSGEQEDTLHVLIYDGKENVVYQKYHSKEDHFEKKNETLTKDTYRVCFYTVNDASFYVTFELYTKSEKGDFIDIATDENVNEMKTDLISVHDLFENIEKYIKFNIDRRTAHSKAINNLTDNLKSIYYWKFFIFLSVCLLQIFFIRKFFGSDSKATFDRNPFATNEPGIGI